MVKDSFEFADLIRDHPTNEQTETFMCSFDVASLFTNVPIDETIEFYIWLNALYRSEFQQPDIEEGLLKNVSINQRRKLNSVSTTLCIVKWMESRWGLP